MTTDEEESINNIRVESLCTNCFDNGTTTFLTTNIPFYKDIIIASFECSHCGCKNNEVQRSSKISEKGIRYELLVSNYDDLNRNVIRSEHTSISIPHLEFEIPSGSQEGGVTTIEGIIDRAITGLKQEQEYRYQVIPDVARKIDELLEKLENLKTMKTPFRVIFSDISGICYVSNPNAPKKDDNLIISTFARTRTQDHLLGIYGKNELKDNACDDDTVESLDPDENLNPEQIKSEVLQLPNNCPSCGVATTVNMKVQEIPHFKEVVIMAVNCEKCGYRSNEVKSGTGIEPKGIKLTVAVTDPDDFNRDVLKSDTCSMIIPELELDVGPSVFSGRFTTVEGLLNNAKEDLSKNLFTDSADPVMKARIDEFIKKFDEYIDGKKSFTLILDDPAGNSYIQSYTDPEPEDKLKIEYYERNEQQNDDLGLNDMKVENYEDSAKNN